MSDDKPSVAYVFQYYPGLTSTFLYREVAALRERGVQIITLANRKPTIDSLSPEAYPYLEETQYVFPLQRLLIIRAHLYYLFLRPRRYIGALHRVLTGTFITLRDRLRSIMHFGGAVYLAYGVKDNPPDHLHAHFTHNGATIALVMSRLLQIPFSMTAHSKFIHEQVMLPEKLHEAQFIVSISHDSKRRLLAISANRDDLAQRVHIVRCGLNLDLYRPAYAASTPPVIISMAQLAERKGIRYLVEACALLVERGRSFLCIISGDGPEYERIASMIAHLHLEEKVLLNGRYFQTDLDRLMGQGDVFVLPCVTAANGNQDGIPVVLMEAMAMELPIVSTRISGIPELVDDGENGFLVEEKDVVALMDAVEKLLLNPQLRREMGKKGRQKIEMEFNIKRSAVQLEELFTNYSKIA